MTIKKQSKSDSNNYAEPRDRHRPITRDKSERNLRNQLRGLKGSIWLDDEEIDEMEWLDVYERH